MLTANHKYLRPRFRNAMASLRRGQQSKCFNWREYRVKEQQGLLQQERLRGLLDRHNVDHLTFH